jgi:hypothetical protein
MLGRRQTDGSIIFPARGRPPAESEDYKRDTADPYRLLPVWRPCPFRQEVKFTYPCCPDKQMISYACDKGFQAGPDECLQCHKSGRLATLTAEAAQ